MKLQIQIPCFNEEDSLGELLDSLPRQLPGIRSIEVVVIDDGSTDNSVETARNHGNPVIISLGRHRGLAEAFSRGIEHAIKSGADLIVNTDADLQYPSEYIEPLIKPILEGYADISIGDRLSASPAAFPFFKMVLQKSASSTLRFFSKTNIKDASSGFRALNREAFESLVLHSEYTYTLESIMQAGLKKFRIANVPITTNGSRRKSRLITNQPSYITLSAITIIRAYLMYHPLQFFSILGMILLLGATVLGGRFLFYYFTGDGTGHVQSLILTAILAGMGFQSIVLGLVADVVAANRRLLERQRLHNLKPKLSDFV